MSEKADWELIALARSGEMEAFTEIVRRYQQPVIHFCMRMVGSLQDAEDLAQESFVRLYRNLARLEPRAQFSTLLFGIARNLTLNALRDRKRRGREKVLTMSQLTGDDGAVYLPGAADSGRLPDHSAQIGEMREAIERALELLAPEHREVLLLREIEGLDYDAIAHITRVRKGTVKSRLSRAREQLRQHILALEGKQ